MQIWVHSHGKAGGFSVNEVADLLATAYRVSGEVDPGVRPPAVHVCAILPEVKHSHCKWMLDALQVLLPRAHAGEVGVHPAARGSVGRVCQ